MRMHRHESQAVLAEINIIPLVDIMLVLLIIFMVAAPLLQQGVDVDLPEVNAGAVSQAKDDLVLTINSNGQLFLGDDKSNIYTLGTLEEKLKSIFENKQKKEIYLHADKDAVYGYVVQVMALCQKAGVERMGMITTPEEASPSKDKKNR